MKTVGDFFIFLLIQMLTNVYNYLLSFVNGTFAYTQVVRHAAKIAHKVCENRKIYLKFLNKPNFNVPKNWGKIFGKTA